MSPNEWIYLAGQHLAPPFAIHLVVEGTGTLDHDRLTEAVSRSAAACPGTRLTRRDKMWVDSGQAPALHTAENWDTHTSRALDTSAARSCEIVLREGDRPALLFRAHHAVMDARGVLDWALDTFRALRGQEPLGALSGLSDLALLNETGSRRRRPSFIPRFRSPLASRAGGPGHGWLHRNVDGSHAALVAKAATALTHLHGSATRVMVPIDLRRHRPQLQSTANLSLPVFLDGQPTDTWEQWQERLLRALHHNHDLSQGTEAYAPRVPLKPLSTILHLADLTTRALDRYPCSALLTHLGRIQEEDLQAPGFEPTEVYTLPQQVPFVPVSLAATEFGGTTRLTVARPAEPHAVRKAEQLLDAVAEELLPTHLRGPHVIGRRSTHPPTTLVHMLRQQAEQTPNATALTGPEGTLSYAELARRSDAAAAVLRRHGSGPGTSVGLLTHRTNAAIIGLWAIVKSGAAYVPLDPNHPPRRTASLLSDSDAVLCLVGRSTSSRRAALPCPTLTLEDLSEGPSSQSPPNDNSRPYNPAPNDLAYVIYTSGSTGTPKGVMVEHKALTDYTRWAIRHYGIDEHTRFAVFTSLAFDLTGTAHLLPLLTGGSIVLIPDEPDHATVTGLLTSSGANSLKLTPAHLELIIRLGIRPQGFRLVIAGGEQLRARLAARAQEAFGPRCRIVNEYGPTEATIGCITHTFRPQHDTERHSVPIGLPCENTAVHLLDPRGVPVAPGEPGEIHLATTQLARGYLHRPDLTRAHFRTLADGTRVYRTGDLAQLNSEGLLEFLGRNDAQLSIHGHRIDPLEVEAALETHPDVGQAVVLAAPLRHDGPPVLCAYITGNTEPGSLREHAEKLLPAHLVPAAIYAVDSIPLTANGKVDTTALTRESSSRKPARDSTNSNQDPFQQAVTNIWADILQIDPRSLTPESNFIHLGGDSIELLTMLQRVAQEVVAPQNRTLFQLKIRALVTLPTLHHIAVACQG
ncbi:non-ribosomal peptide synthetase [Streptomyces sp. NPDC057910]|uniref:non-ribosomal peptide synthetase n=1 Tax=Streptomyces sp. NPDC057910 TaxID=3346278 RepID=UPI0036EA14E1